MRFAAGLMVLCAAVSMALSGGSAAFGRVLLAAGLPGMAAALFSEPEWRGVALFRVEDMEGAAEAFRKGRAFYNLGNAQTHLGQYAAALEAFDIAISGGDKDARANFDVVSAFYAGLAVDPDALGLFPKRKTGPKAESSIARGNARAAGSGDQETNTSTMLSTLELDSRGRLGVRRVFDDKFMVADERWLQQLADVPGEYLTARISHERKRRAKLGLTPPQPDDPR